MRIILIVTSLLLLINSSVYPVEPPHLVEEWLKNADEHITIEVIDVKTKDFNKKPYVYKTVNARAKIMSVTNTKNNLLPGMMIFIVYGHQFKADDNGRPVPGPSIIPVLEKGWKLDAYLNRMENVPKAERLLNFSEKGLIFSPAALADSFNRLND
jgi:hypothetical protein